MVGEKSTNSDKLSSFTSLMRSWVSHKSELTNVNLDDVFQYWQEHGLFPKVKGTLATAVVRPSALRCGPKPIYGELLLNGWSSNLKNRVSLSSVVKKLWS